MEKEEPIISIRQYDNLIEANLAKTKLDAYGVPCFLTDENFGSLYPIRNDVFPGIRLYIFEKDTDQTLELLDESTLTSNEQDAIACPRCKSNQVVLKKQNKIWHILSGEILGALFLPRPKLIYKCQICGKEFPSL